MEDRVVRRRAGTILPLAATLVVLALAILAASHITIDHDITRLLPDSDTELVQSAKALRSFLERTIVDVGCEDGSHSVELLGEVADRMVEDLKASGTVLRARAHLGLEDALEFVDFVRARAPLLLSESAWAEIEAKLRPEAVSATLETLERRIQEPDGAYLAGQAPLDPLGFGNLVLAPLAALGAGPPGAKLVDGRILSADGKHLLALIEPVAPASDLAHTTRFLEALAGSEARLSQVPAYRGVRLREMGAHRASKDNELQIRRDVKVTSLAASVLVALLIFLCFGRLRLALLSLSPALVGGVVGLGLFSLFRASVAAPALGFGAVLIGLTDDFAIHVLSSLTKDRERNEIPARAILLGALTTSLACALLCGSSLPGIRDIGLLGSIGILVAAFYALWVLPSLKPFLGAPKRPIVDLERLMQRSPVSRRVAWIALLATPLLALGAWRIGFDDEVRNLSSSSPEAAADEELLRATWGDSQTSALVIEAPSVQAALEANDELARWLDVAQREGQLLGHASIAGLVPALKTQEERWLRWRSFWTPERREELVASLSVATARTRFRAEAFAPFLRSLEAPPSWIEPAHFDQGDQEGQGSSAEWVADRLVHDGENWRVLTPTFTKDRDQLARLAERLRVEQPEVVLANSEALMRRVAGLVSREMVVLGMLSFLVIAAVVFGWLADWRLTLVVLLPLVLGLLWTLGILGWLGQKLNLINSVFVVFQFGIAVDYSIFIAASYLERLRTGLERTAEARGAALLCALTTCAGFGALGLAGHPVLFTIGLTAFVAIACAAAAAQIFVPVLCEALLGAQGLEGLPAQRSDLATVNGPQWHRLLAGMYRHHGPFLKNYAASKAKRDPLVFALPGLCPGTGPILIVGCGYGVMTARLASAYPERAIVALDPDVRKLDAAQSALGNRFAVRFLREDVRSHASSSIYEWVCLVDVLHYWDEAAQREILACLRARMSANSRLLFRDGCAGPGTRNWIVRGAESLALLSGFTHPSGKLNFHSEEKWRRLLGECGFCVESAHPELGVFSNLVLICSRRANP